MSEVGRRERKRQALREQVLEASEHELRAHGAGGFSVERIAASADVAVQTVYNHFGGRDGLLLAVAERALSADRAVMGPAYDATGTPAERVEEAARAYAAFALAAPHHFRLLAFPPGARTSVVSPAEDDTARRIAAGVVEQNDRLARAIADGVRDGTLAPVDPERASTALWAMLNGLLALSWRPDSLGTTEAETLTLLETAIEMLRHGLEAP